MKIEVISEHKKRPIWWWEKSGRKVEGYRKSLYMFGAAHGP
jgi:hypothetical protein